MCLLPPPPTPPAPVPRKPVTSLGHSLDGHALSKWPASALSCCHQYSRLWGPFGNDRVATHLEQAEGRVVGCREAPRDPTAWSMQIMCISVLCRTRQGPLTTVPPSHHSTSPPLLAQPAQEELDIRTVSVKPPTPPIALKSLLFVRDSRRLLVFVLIFSSFHCDTKKLNE